MSNLKFWLSLEQAEGIGPAHMMEIHSVLEARHLDIGDLEGLDEKEISGETGISPRLASSIRMALENSAVAESDYLSLIDDGYEVIPFFSGRYPWLLKERLTTSIPPFLYAKGNIELLKERVIAILGDRDVSAPGQKIAFFGSRELARHRIPVISGFAAGVDMIAHRAALLHGGATLAVLPYGIRHLKAPEALRDLDDPDRLLLLSPFPPAKEATKYNAFIRNRVVCAMSCAVFIVEAPADGGIFEAAKSASGLKVPLYTVEYASYPENALGNSRILSEMGGIAVRGRMVEEMRVPNMDRIISHARVQPAGVKER